MNGWVPATLAAEVACVKYGTLKSWAQRKRVRSACRVKDRVLVVWWPDVDRKVTDAK